jgi:ubiquinone/menaquinone biosynthesis C-methylase UbiE
VDVELVLHDDQGPFHLPVQGSQELRGLGGLDVLGVDAEDRRELMPLCLRAERLLRPGMRVAMLPCGTGYAAAVVSGRVAPSGAVVALDPDEQSIEFARLRYPIHNVSYECGGMEHLTGETDGAFDAVIAILPHGGSSDDARINELWRLAGPGGWLLVACPMNLGQKPGSSRLCSPACVLTRRRSTAHLRAPPISAW